MTDTSYIIQKGRELQKLGHGEGGTHREGAEHIVEIPIVAERDRTLAEQVGERGLSLGLRMLYIKKVVHGKEFAAEFFSGLGIGILLQTVNDFVIFDNLQYFFVHK